MIETVCSLCQEKYPKIDFTSRMCEHMTDVKSDWLKFLSIMIGSIIFDGENPTENPVINAILKSQISKNKEPIEIKIFINGIEIPFVNFFKKLHSNFNIMAAFEAEKLNKHFIKKCKRKFSKIYLFHKR